MYPQPLRLAWHRVRNKPTKIVPTLLVSSTTINAQVQRSNKWDLSHNNLSGPIPNFLGQLSSLMFLDLSSNDLSGPIPYSLLQRSQNGSLSLRVGDNVNLCGNGTACRSDRKKINGTLLTAIVVPIAAAIALFVILFLLCQVLKGKAKRNATGHEDESALLENREFSYKELKHITNNFSQQIGKGGFGPVFLGYLENGKSVAVKVRSESSSQGGKEFLAEAQHLTRIHHKNLVSLVGYCKDRNHLALVYEYMPEGNLQDHLRATSTSKPLSWEQRLQIALDAAQGLEYLHIACKPALIHRDVKSRNILLTTDLGAKIADFGLTKAFSESETHITTEPAGTMGYLDPEYVMHIINLFSHVSTCLQYCQKCCYFVIVKYPCVYQLFRYFRSYHISEKSDLYSFGVVLLELITGHAPVIPISDSMSIHIGEWVHQSLDHGNIESIVDAKMGGDYDINSVWKAADLALHCKRDASRERPTMAERLFDEVHACTAQLTGVNRAYVVLPKGDGIPSPGAFRPVSLQNGDVKILCRGLITRVYRFRDKNQPGCRHGSIKASQCCRKRSSPIMVLKLDFAKAFDSINWCSLRQLICHSSRPTVLLNRIQGKWFSVCRGLRQGYPLSPYIFLIVVDFLQQMIRQDNVLQHPSPLVAANNTLVPMHVDALELDAVVAALACTVESFTMEAWAAFVMGQAQVGGFSADDRQG
ncbi:unnamed protein product [Triticum turgidum subsp. durum]|uniref:Protein kinase domain-containing protein n=1 Tax=Triticum turgidum subsp. durum TaxID=4567 RepID=A0A9R0XVK0_TRITD|nr:unnamed protein product [Triticum turgidum subsp. durum]